MGVGCPWQPVRNDIVTPRHLFPIRILRFPFVYFSLFLHLDLTVSEIHNCPSHKVTVSLVTVSQSVGDIAIGDGVSVHHLTSDACGSSVANTHS